MAETRQEWHSSESVGVVASVAAFALFAIKLMAVSHSSVNTAKALLQTSSLGESILGVALSGFHPYRLRGRLRLRPAAVRPRLRRGERCMAVVGMDIGAGVRQEDRLLISIAWAVAGAVLLAGLLLMRRRLRGEVGASLAARPGLRRPRARGRPL